MILFKQVNESFRHIEGREWALLFLETLGVIVGILLAFELQEWASQRQAAQDQHKLLERLLDESEATVSYLRADREQFDGIVGAEKDFATMLVHEGKCPAEPMWQAVDTLAMYPSVAPPSSVYQEVMGSGGLSKIQDAKVRRSISFFHAVLDEFDGQNSYFRQRLAYPLTDASPEVTYDFDLSKDEPQVSHYNRAALCQSHAFRNGIADDVRNHMAIAGFHTELARAAVRMCARLGAELGKACLPSGGPLTGSDAKEAADAVSNRESAQR